MAKMLVDVYTEGCCAAAHQIIIDKRLEVAQDELVPHLTSAINAGYSSMLTAMREAHECHMGEEMLRKIINAECVGVAINALKSLGAM